MSRETSFEMRFSRTVPDDTSVPVLHPSSSVGGWTLHLLSGTISVNDMAWALEGQYLDRTQMDGRLKCLDDMNDTCAILDGIIE